MLPIPRIYLLTFAKSNKSNEIKPIQVKSNFLANCGHPCYHAHIANASSYISRRTCPRRRTHHTRRNEID